MNSAFGVPGPETRVYVDGQCRLTKSGTNLLLSSCDGNRLWIGDRAFIIPSDGITFKPTGLGAATLYYAYIHPDGRGFFSTTAYAADSATGLKTKSNDRFARLVGMARTDGSAAFADSVTQRFVRSYFNDLGSALVNAFTADRTTTSATYAELNSEIRCEFICWTGETVRMAGSGPSYNAGGINAGAETSIGFDGTTAEDTYSACFANTGSFPTTSSFSVAVEKSGLTEGYHYATLLGKVASSTGHWAGSATAGTRATLRGFLRR